MARWQTLPSSCGPAAVVNALQALRIVRSEDEIAALAGTTGNGTSAEGMLTALKQIASSTNRPMPGTIYEAREDVAALKLVQCLQQGRPLILCVTDDGEGWGHWISSVGILGLSNPTIMLTDSANQERLLYLSVQETMEWMRAPGERKPFYAIIV